MWEDIKDWIKQNIVEFILGAIALAFVVVIFALITECAMTIHFEREFARENGYYPTKASIIDERSE